MNTFTQIVKNFKLSLLGNRLPDFYARLQQQLTIESCSKLIKYLKRENLDLLFYFFLKESKLNSEILCELKREMQNVYVLEKTYQLLQRTELKVLAAELQRPFIVFKGLTLCHSIKKDLYKRSVDIDFLINKSDEETIIQKLNILGYDLVKKVCPYAEFSMKKGKILTLDIHYNLNAGSPFFKLFDFNFNGMLKESEFLFLDKRKVLSFNPEFTLLHLCLHFTINHNASSFINMFEISEFLKYNYGKIRQSKFIELIYKHRCVGIIYFVLHLLCQYTCEKHVLNLAKAVREQLPSKSGNIEAFIYKNNASTKLIENRLYLDQISIFPIVAGSPSNFFRIVSGHLYITWRKLYLVASGEWTLHELLSNTRAFFSKSNQI